MSDGEIIVSARADELRALCANLHRALAGGDAIAAENFAYGLAVLDAAQSVAPRAFGADGATART